MKFKYLFVSALILCSFISKGQLQGTYVIGPAPSDYVNLTDFMDALASSGQSDSVTALLKPGTHVIGVRSETGTITPPLLITSIGNDSINTILEFIQFSRMDSLTIRKVTITPKLSTAFMFPNKGAHFDRSGPVLIENCIVKGLSQTYYENGFSVSDSKGFVVRNCHFYNLKSGVAYSGYSGWGGGTHENENAVLNCRFDSVDYAVSFKGDFDERPLCNKNVIDKAVIGIEAVDASTGGLDLNMGMSIEQNLITRSSQYGASLHHGLSPKIFFINNMISGGISWVLDKNNTPMQSGQVTISVAISLGSNVGFVNNSIYGGVSLFGNSKISNCAFYTADEIAVYGTSGPLSSDLFYNSFYTSAGADTVALSGGNIVSLNDPAYTQIGNIWADPYFTSQFDLHSCSRKLISAGYQVSFNTDFDGESRNPLRPDIGADEFKSSSLPPCDPDFNEGCADSVLSIRLSDRSIRGSNTIWNFSNGTSDTGRTIIKTFATKGLYSFQMVTMNAWGSDTINGVADLSGINPQSIRAGGNFLSIDPGYADYQWYLDSTAIPGANSSLYHAREPGVYRLQYINEKGCWVWALNPTYLSLPGEFITENSDIDLFPNPTKDLVSITGSEKLLSKIEILDSFGKLVLSMNPQKKEIDIHLKDYPEGIYFVKIYAGTSYAVFKLHKIH